MSTAIRLDRPWERWRMSRLLDVYTESELQGIYQIRNRGPQIPPYAQQTLTWDARILLSSGRPTRPGGPVVRSYDYTLQTELLYYRYS